MQPILKSVNTDQGVLAQACAEGLTRRCTGGRESGPGELGTLYQHSLKIRSWPDAELQAMLIELVRQLTTKEVVLQDAAGAFTRGNRGQARMPFGTDPIWPIFRDIGEAPIYPPMA